ncbi:hypothetical protein ACWEWX_49040, partial [Streptomyces asiaticus]
YAFAFLTNASAISDIRFCPSFHDLDAIERLATRVVVLGGGRVLATGAPGNILHDPNLPLEVAR